MPFLSLFTHGPVVVYAESPLYFFLWSVAARQVAGVHNEARQLARAGVAGIMEVL